MGKCHNSNHGSGMNGQLGAYQASSASPWGISKALGRRRWKEVPILTKKQMEKEVLKETTLPHNNSVWPVRKAFGTLHHNVDDHILSLADLLTPVILIIMMVIESFCCLKSMAWGMGYFNAFFFRSHYNQMIRDYLSLWSTYCVYVLLSTAGYPEAFHDFSLVDWLRLTKDWILTRKVLVSLNDDIILKEGLRAVYCVCYVCVCYTIHYLCNPCWKFNREKNQH